MENPTIIVDSSSSAIQYEGVQWEIINTNNTFGRTQRVWRADIPSNEPSNLTFRFLGKSVELYGTLNRELELTSRVDNAPYNPLDETKGAPEGRRGVKLFEAGVLSGSHTVVLEPQAGQLTVDYFIYTPVGKTLYEGEDLIFDDTHSSLNFTGTWTSTISPDLPELPFNNSLMSTAQSGASFAFAFTGASISVHGGFNPAAGVVSADFSVDDDPPTSLVLANQTAQDGWSLHQQFFQYNVTDDPSGEHILKVTVSEASEAQPFLLDYVIVKGNSHTKLAEREFRKTGSALSTAGMRIGLVIMGIVILILAWVSWAFYRKRRKAKGLPHTKR